MTFALFKFFNSTKIEKGEADHGAAMDRVLLLSEIPLERILVCCDQCGLVSNLSLNALLGRHGDISLDQLKIELIRRCAENRSSTPAYDCGINFRNIRHLIED